MKSMTTRITLLAGFFMNLTFGAEKPNVIFILADDLGWADLGCYGSGFYETPNLDKLASQGMRFTDAYAACCVCSPRRVRRNASAWMIRTARPSPFSISRTNFKSASMFRSPMPPA